MSPPTVDLSLPSDAALLAAADPNPQTQAARLTAAGDPAKVADIGRRLQSTGADLDRVYQDSWRTQSVLAGGYANDGVPVYDANAHRALLPAGFADAGSHLDATGRRMAVVSDELRSAITDLGKSLDGLAADLGRQRSAFAQEVDAARGPDGLIPMDALAGLQARRQAAAADMQESVNTCGRQVLGRIGVYELSLNDCRRLLAEITPTGTATAASPGVAVPGAGSPAGTQLAGQVSGLTVPAPAGPSINIHPIPPPYAPDRGFTPLPEGPDGPLINVPGPQGGSIYDGPGSGQRTDGPRVQINTSTPGDPGTAGAAGTGGSGDPIAGGKPNRGRFPLTAPPGDILVNRGNDGKVNSYAVYGPDGKPVKRVDVRGRAHGPFPTPHVQEYTRDTNPVTGQEFVRPGRVRPATPDEVAGLQ